jgi:uncharacterized protein GlcG (DUF336 family)
MNQNEIREIVKNTVSEYKNAKKTMTLSLAERLADAVIAKAREMDMRIVVCVSDAAGNPKVVKIMDDAYIASYDIAVNKAFTSVALKMPTTALKTLAKPGGELYGIQFTNNGRIIVFGGGEPLNTDGKIVGGLGVSGGSEEQDTLLGRFGKDYFENKM